MSRSCFFARRFDNLPHDRRQVEWAGGNAPAFTTTISTLVTIMPASQNIPMMSTRNDRKLKDALIRIQALEKELTTKDQTIKDLKLNVATIAC